jgi:aquaporin Z
VQGGRFEATNSAQYIVAQVAVAIVAAGVLYLIASDKAVFIVTGVFTSNGFSEHFPGGYFFIAAFVAEVVMTMMFLIVILGSTDERAPKGLLLLPSASVLRLFI